jgi:hypothetical protein
VAATQTTIDLAKFILSAGVIDLARFNAIFGLDGGCPVLLEKLTYSHDTSPEWPTESQKAIMLEGFYVDSSERTSSPVS